MKSISRTAVITILSAAISASAQEQPSEQQQSAQQKQAQQSSEKSQQQLKVSEQDMKQQVTDANKASKLMGMTVKNKQDEDLGKIKDLVIDFQSGKVAYAVLTAGGTLGFGGKMVAIPVEALTLQQGEKSLLLDLSKQQLSQAQGFNEQNWPDLDAAQKGQTIGLAKSQPQEAQGGTGSQAQQQQGGQSSASQSGSITNLQQLAATADPSSIQGKRVNLQKAQVHQVIGQDTVTVTSEDASQQVLVKSQRPVQNLKPGQTVTVSGSVRPMPQNPAQLGIDEAAAQKIQGQKFYIQANQITPSNQ